MLDQVIAAKDMNDNECSAILEAYTFEADFGSGHAVELCEGGSHRDLTREDVDEYVHLFLLKYTEDDSVQFNLLFKGFEDVCARRLLLHMNAEITSKRTCSTAQINVKAFKAATYFESEERKELSDWYWQLIEEDFSNNDLQLLVKFICGRSRLQSGDTYYISPSSFEPSEYNSEDNTAQ